TLREVGLDETREYLTRFGFELDQLPRSETIALGAGSLTPMKMAQGFSVFANGGYYVEPYYISHIEDPYGNVVFESQPQTICQQDCTVATEAVVENENGESTEITQPFAKQVISEQNAFIMREMMYSNIWGGGNWREGTGWNGTGWRAQTLGRRDIGGKTG
ncbi:penicillin-sensitive transpeptidase, partial [Vibrio vulnificus]